MTSENSPTVENEALLTKIGAIEQEVTAVKAAVRRASTMRLLLLGVAIVMLAGFVWIFYSLAKDFTSKENLDLLAAKAKERIDSSSGPAAIKHAQALVDNCKPVLIKAFSEQVEADTPKYTEVLNQERIRLVENLESQLRAKVTAHYQQSEKRYQKILQEEFPQLDDPELMLDIYASIEQIMDRLVEQYYSEQLRAEVQELGDTWGQFDMADLPGEGEPPLEQQFAASLLRLAAYRLDDADLTGMTEAITFTGIVGEK